MKRIVFEIIIIAYALLVTYLFLFNKKEKVVEVTNKDTIVVEKKIPITHIKVKKEIVKKIDTIYIEKVQKDTNLAVIKRNILNTFWLQDSIFLVYDKFLLLKGYLMQHSPIEVLLYLENEGRSLKLNKVIKPDNFTDKIFIDVSYTEKDVPKYIVGLGFMGEPIVSFGVMFKKYQIGTILSSKKLGLNFQYIIN